MVKGTDQSIYTRRGKSEFFPLQKFSPEKERSVAPTTRDAKRSTAFEES